jgi:hypothetical protein
MTCDAHTLTNYKAIVATVSEVMPRNDNYTSHLWNAPHKNTVTAELPTTPAIFAEFIAAIENIAGVEFTRETTTLGGSCIDRFYTLCGVTICAQLCLGF